MEVGRLIYLALVNISLFTAGVTLFTMGVLAVRKPRRWGFYLAAKAGMLAVVGTILALVMPHPVPIPPSPEAATYILGVLLFGIGLTGVSKDIIERTARMDVPDAKED